MLHLMLRTQSRSAIAALARTVDTLPCLRTTHRELISLHAFRHFSNTVLDSKSSPIPDIAAAHNISNASSPSTHLARILDGRAVAATWEDELALEVSDIKSRGGRPPGLGVILVGDRPDSLLYVSRKQEACQRIGMHSVVRQLSSAISQVALRRAVLALCADPSVDGVLVQLPLPGHIDEEDIIEHFDPGKDVDGFHPLNVGRTLMRGRSARFVPCTALGCVELLRRSNVEIHGKSVAIVGDSNIVGMPLAMLFRDEGAATVTVVHRSSYSSLFSSGAAALQEMPALENRKLERKEQTHLPPKVMPESLHKATTMTATVATTTEKGGSDIDRDLARRRAEANACLPHTPGPIYTSNQSPLSANNNHHRELQPYQVTYSSGMRDAYLPPTLNFEDPALVPSHLAELAGITRTADILVVAVGYPHLVKEDWIKPGAVVIDVGINVVDWDYHPPAPAPLSSSPLTSSNIAAAGSAESQQSEELSVAVAVAAVSNAETVEERDLREEAHFHVVGDVDFNQAVRVASALTPVPGGVGPMTIAALLHNTVRAAAVKMGLRNESSSGSGESCNISSGSGGNSNAAE